LWVVRCAARGITRAFRSTRARFDGDATLVDPDPDAPCDRPNLSKDYLAGTATQEWIPRRPPGFHREAGIARVVDRVVKVDRERGLVEMDSGDTLSYEVALLAPGAPPRKPAVSGARLPAVHESRSRPSGRRRGFPAPSQAMPFTTCRASGRWPRSVTLKGKLLQNPLVTWRLAEGSPHLARGSSSLALEDSQDDQ